MNLRAILAVVYATGRATHARQVKGDDPDEKGYTGPPGWGLGVRLTALPSKNIFVEMFLTFLSKSSPQTKTSPSSATP